ncbi:MAG: hypothetical protein ACYS80_09970, partial [Planctomycetota bacterium]
WRNCGSSIGIGDMNREMTLWCRISSIQLPISDFSDGIKISGNRPCHLRFAIVDPFDDAPFDPSSWPRAGHVCY